MEILYYNSNRCIGRTCSYILTTYNTKKRQKQTMKKKRNSVRDTQQEKQESWAEQRSRRDVTVKAKDGKMESEVWRKIGKH